MVTPRRSLTLRDHTMLRGPTFDPAELAWNHRYDARLLGDGGQGLSDGAQIATWTDLGSVGDDITNTAATQRPLYRAAESTFNNRPCADFDGSNDTLAKSTGQTALVPPFTLFAVFCWDAGSGAIVGNNVFSNSTPGAYALTIESSAAVSARARTDDLYVLTGTGPHAAFVYVPPAAGNAFTLKVDSTSVGDSKNLSAAPANWGVKRVGASGVTAGAFFNGKIGFLGFIGRALTTQEETDLLAWARSYYGTP